MKLNSDRENAIKWWRSLTSLQKAEFCNNYSASIGYMRDWQSLTGREIENIYKKEETVDIRNLLDNVTD